MSMSQEHMKNRIQNALDLLQVITEDAEDNFLCKSVTDTAVRARATITISTLYVLTDYLRSIAEDTGKPT